MLEHMIFRASQAFNNAPGNLAPAQLASGSSTLPVPMVCLPNSSPLRPLWVSGALEQSQPPL